MAQAKKSSIDGYTIEMARTHTLTHNKRRGEEEGADIFLGREDRWMEGGRAGREKGHNELALHEDKVENR